MQVYEKSLSGDARYSQQYCEMPDLYACAIFKLDKTLLLLLWNLLSAFVSNGGV